MTATATASAHEHVHGIGDRLIDMLRRNYAVSASIVSVARAGESDGTLLCMATRDDDDAWVKATQAREVMRQLFPLYSVALVRDALSGSVRAQLLVPSEDEERRLALAHVAEQPWAVGVRRASDVLALTALGSFALALVAVLI